MKKKNRKMKKKYKKNMTLPLWLFRPYKSEERSFRAVKRPTPLVWRGVFQGRQEADPKSLKRGLSGPSRGRPRESEEGSGRQETYDFPSVLPRPQCKIWTLFSIVAGPPTIKISAYQAGTLRAPSQCPAQDRYARGTTIRPALIYLFFWVLI